MRSYEGNRLFFSVSLLGKCIRKHFANESALFVKVVLVCQKGKEEAGSLQQQKGDRTTPSFPFSHGLISSA